MKLGVVGSINIDMRLCAERIPSRGETVKGDSIHYAPGGKGANQAVAMARLGGEVIMLGMVGNDAYGADMLQNMKNQGVNTDCVQTAEGVPTGLAVITVDSGDNTIVVIGGANECVDRAYIDSVADSLKECEYVLLQHEIPQDTVEYVIDFCFENGIRTILNPAPVRAVKPEYIDKVTYITPNEHEAQILFGNGDISDMLKKYPEKLIVTQGSRGVSFADMSGRVINVAPVDARVVDTTGAGDTLNGAFAVALSMGRSVNDALEFANIAAGISIEKEGAQGGMPTLDEVLKRLQNI